MIGKLFVETLEVSLVASLLILVFMLCSAGIGRRYAAKWKYWIWLVIAVRMLVPVNPDLSFGRLDLAVSEKFARENPVGSLNRAISGVLTRKIMPAGLSKGISKLTDPAASETGKEENAKSTVKAEHEGENGTGQAVSQVKPAEDKTVDDVTGAEYGISLVDILAVLWLCGACVLFLRQLIGYLRFRRRVLKGAWDADDEDILGLADEILARTNCRNRPRILLLDEAVSPMVIGFVRPCLLLPRAEYSREELSFILKHELTHCRRHDTCYKLLLVAAWSIHWFDPLAWLMVKWAGVDLELSCDEAVVANEPYAVRRAYTQTLLAALGRQCSRKAILTTQWSGGVKMMKKRFKHIIEPSKNKNGLALVALALVLMLASGTCMACGTRVLAAERADTQENLQNRDTLPNDINPEIYQIVNENEPDEQPEDGTEDMNSVNPEIYQIVYENVDELPEPGTEDVNEENGVKPVYVYQSESDALRNLITDRALKFFWAWARGDQDALKRCTADIAESYSYPLWTAADEGYDPEKFTDACMKEIRFDAEDADVAYVSVEFRMASEDDYLQYMEMELVKRGDSWKVYGAGLEM